MYDTLLDDLEDDVTPNADEAVELVDKAVDVDDVDDDLLTDDSTAVADLDIDGKAEELLPKQAAPVAADGVVDIAAQLKQAMRELRGRMK